MTSPTVLWVARCPTPYRYPIWDSIATKLDIRIAFLQEQGVGRSWRLQERSFPQTVLKSAGPKYREDRLSTLLPGWSAPLGNPGVLVMQGLWETPAAWQIALWARQHRIPIIYFSESTLATMRWRRGPLAWARSVYMRNAEAVLTPGPSATEAVEAHGVAPSRVRTSVNVVDVHGFHERAIASRQAHSTQAATPHQNYIIVARLLRRKNVDQALRAFATIYRSGDSLTVIGDGPERESLTTLAQHLGIVDAVEFLGHQEESEVIECMAHSHTLVLPSTEEVWGLVVNEALACGLHAVVSSRCGVSSSVESMSGVWVADPTTPDLARAMSASRDHWSGWIERPEILLHDSKRFVDDLQVLINDVVG